MKVMRDMKDYAKDLGLSFAGVEEGSNHTRIMFTNNDNFLYGIALSRTKDDPHRRKIDSMKRDLRRFSERKYDGLPVKKL